MSRRRSGGSATNASARFELLACVIFSASVTRRCKAAARGKGKLASAEHQPPHFSQQPEGDDAEDDEQADENDYTDEYPLAVRVGRRVAGRAARVAMVAA